MTFFNCGLMEDLVARCLLLLKVSSLELRSSHLYSCIFKGKLFGASRFGMDGRGEDNYVVKVNKSSIIL